MYGRNEKDFSERYEVQILDTQGWLVFDVVAVGRAYSLALFAVTPSGAIVRRLDRDRSNDDNEVVVRARAMAEEAARKRKSVHRAEG